jgi:hypothetical protein
VDQIFRCFPDIIVLICMIGVFFGFSFSFCRAFSTFGAWVTSHLYMSKVDSRIENRNECIIDYAKLMDVVIAEQVNV